MTTKLKLYNLALGTYVGTQRLANLTENVASRHALDAVYDSSVQYMLEQGIWKFALRVAELIKDVTAPTLHREHSYAIPDDFVRLARISSDDRLDAELLDYREANGKWYSNVDPIFIEYVSNDDDYGLDLDLWPANFEQAVASWMAYQSVLDISKDRSDRADLLTLHQRTLANARRLDAVDEAVKRKPTGSWVRSRGFGAINGTRRGL
jgi:hypothetical protein